MLCPLGFSAESTVRGWLNEPFLVGGGCASVCFRFVPAREQRRGDEAEGCKPVCRGFLCFRWGGVLNRYIHAYGWSCIFSAVSLMGIVFFHEMVQGYFLGAERNFAILLFEALVLFPSSAVYVGYLFYDKIWRKT